MYAAWEAKAVHEENTPHGTGLSQAQNGSPQTFQVCPVQLPELGGEVPSSLLMAPLFLGEAAISLEIEQEDTDPIPREWQILSM